MKIVCTTPKVTGCLVAKCLKKLLSNLKMSYAFLLLQKVKCSEFADLFCDDRWLSVACYLAGIFEKIRT